MPKPPVTDNVNNPMQILGRQLWPKSPSDGALCVREVAMMESGARVLWIATRHRPGETMCQVSAIHVRATGRVFAFYRQRDFSNPGSWNIADKKNLIEERA